MVYIQPAAQKDLTHRRFRSLLSTFRPADAAFVLHLAQCERCRDLAQRWLPVENQQPPVPATLRSLSPVERDFIAHLSRWEFSSLVLQATSSADREGDLPVRELQEFIASLQEDQALVIRHLLTCENCRTVAVRTLAPKDGPTPRADEASASFTATAA